MYCLSLWGHVPVFAPFLLPCVGPGQVGVRSGRHADGLLALLEILGENRHCSCLFPPSCLKILTLLCISNLAGFGYQSELELRVAETARRQYNRLKMQTKAEIRQTLDRLLVGDFIVSGAGEGEGTLSVKFFFSRVSTTMIKLTKKMKSFLASKK